MPQNTSEKHLSWTDLHEAFCYQHHICPAAKTLWQWLMRQGEIASEIEPHLVKEFNTWVTKVRGKGYDRKHLNYIFNQLVESRIIRVIKKFSWAEFRLVVRPVEWLNPPRKKRGKKSQNQNLSPTLDPSNDLSAVAGSMQQQHSNSSINQEILSESGIHIDDNVTEVLDCPNWELRIAIVLFKIRGGFAKIENPEGFIRDCVRGR
jgi:hypothetical protein